MLAKKVFEAVRDSRSRTRGIIIDGLTVGRPQGVEGHRMTSLQTKTVVATKETGTARRPRKQGLIKSDWVAETENEAEVGPNVWGQRTGEEKMTEGLRSRTVVTQELLRSKMKDAVTERKCIHEQFVPSLTMPGKKGRAPKAAPNIRRRSG